MEDIRRENRSLSILFIGAKRGVGTTTLTVNIAAILGVVARRRTLLLDISGNEVGVCDYLGIPNKGGILNLTTPFLEKRHISPGELAREVVRYEPGTPWPTGVSRLDVLSGFVWNRLSPAEKDYIHSYRGIYLVKAVCESAREAGYEFILADGGVWPKQRRGMWLGLSQCLDCVVLVSTAQSNDVVADVRLPVEILRGYMKWPTLLVLTYAPKRWLKFAWQHRGEVFFDTINYMLVPSIEKENLDKYAARGIPLTIHELQDTKQRPSAFTLALVSVASVFDPDLNMRMLDSQGRQLRMAREILGSLFGRFI